MKGMYMLRFAEELLLLLLDEHSGDLIPLPAQTLHLALAGAVLMDLQREARIDTDLETLFLADATPLDDDLLDPTLAAIAREDEKRDARFWVEHTAQRGEEIRHIALSRLVERGILETDEGGFWALLPLVGRSRRYPVIDGVAREEVRLRIMRILFSDEIPDPDDIVLICLANACDLFPRLLSPSELEEAQARIAVVGRLDLLGQAVSRSIRAVEDRPVSHAAKDIPQVRGLPILGSALGLGKDPRAFFTEHYLNLGPVFRIKALGKSYIILAGADANMFLQREGRLYFSSQDYWAGFCKELDVSRHITGMDGSEHVRMRRAKKDGYSRAVLENNIEEAVDITRRYIAEWKLNEPQPALHALRYMMTDQMGILMTGVSPRAYLDDFAIFSKVLLSARSTGWLIRTPRYRRARRQVETLYEKILAAHEGPRHNRRPDFIDDVLELHRADPVFMPEADLFISALGPYFGGLDTATGTCAFMLYVLLTHPDLLQRMRAEADELFANGMPTADGLRRMDVTHRIAMETLRLYPVAPAVPRKVINAFEFAGYTIPVGERVFIATTVPHYLPEFFPDPERFDIDRYLPDRAEHRQRGAYAPFGLGIHRCLGSNFAETQIALTLATILHDCELKIDPPGYTLKIDSLPSPSPDKKFKFKVVRRR